jgi:hypothetical protein
MIVIRDDEMKYIIIDNIRIWLIMIFHRLVSDKDDVMILFFRLKKLIARFFKEIF